MWRSKCRRKWTTSGPRIGRSWIDGRLVALGRPHEGFLGLQPIARSRRLTCAGW